MPKFKTLGERCKFYEQNYSPAQLCPLTPVVARIDGRAFHTFCRGLRKPYDPRLTELMIDTTSYLVSQTGAVVGYCQSDEISLVWYSDNLDTQLFFDGRRDKMVSSLAAMASVYFNRNLSNWIPEKANEWPTFDARVWNVPTKGEAVANLLWRERDATKNAITLAASAYYSHNELHGKNGSEKQEMLWQKGINFNNFADEFKRGSFIRAVQKPVPFSAEELDRLPEKHEARSNPELLVLRKVIERIDMPPFDKVTNKIGVIFNGESPSTENQ